MFIFPKSYGQLTIILFGYELGIFIRFYGQETIVFRNKQKQDLNHKIQINEVNYHNYNSFLSKPNPTRIWAKTIKTVVIIHNYLDLLVSENYGLLPIKTNQNRKVHSK